MRDHVDDIRALRTQSNAAIAALDPDRVVAFMDAQVEVMVAGGPTLVGRAANRDAFAQQMAMPGFGGYVRTPTQVLIETNPLVAREQGTWLGRWHANGRASRRATGRAPATPAQEQRGTYSAEWCFGDAGWLIVREVYRAATHEATRRTVLGVVALLLGALLHPLLSPLPAQSAAPRNVDTAAVARSLMAGATFATLVTLDAEGAPRSRTVQPRSPDADFTVWLATNPHTRKLQDIARNPRVVLHYFDPARMGYVSLVGRARIARDRSTKDAHWDPAWNGFYRDRDRDVVLIGVTPTRLEIVSDKDGITGDQATWRPPTWRPSASTPSVSQPARMVADSNRWIVSNHGREAGDLVVVTRGDSVRARWVFTDRNRGTRLETRYRLGPDLRPLSGEARSVRADGGPGDLADVFSSTADSIIQGIPGTAGSLRRSARTPGDMPTLRGDTPWALALLARAALASPIRSLRIAGGPIVRAEVIADTLLRQGGAAQRARLVMLYRGATPNPQGVWLDAQGGLLATEVAWFITVRPDVVPLLPQLRAIELRWRDARAEAAARTVGTATGSLVLRNGNVFDSEQGILLPRHTVVITAGRITAVGPDASTPVPSGATVIDATGKTIMPGMWEMHAHAQVGTQYTLGMTQLAQGLTTARDMASDVDVAVSLRDRERAGRLAVPRYILAGFIEGPLAWAGPTATVVSTEAEARAWVARYDSLGYKQIKLYNVVHPDLVPVIAAEARKRGLRLSGHIPRGMSIEAAVALGYDEVQHAAFFFSNFYPDSLYLPAMRAYSQVATAVAPTIDVNGAPMTRLLDFLKAHGTVVDGTFNLWIGGGGAIVGAGGSRDQARADSAYMTLLRRLYAAGIPLTAGTDNVSSVTYRRELEMMELAGIPRAKILQVATIEAARLMKDARDYGSIAVGKVGDVLIVNGNPLERIGDLAKLETVVRGRRTQSVVYAVSDLLKAAGATGAGAGAGAAGLGAWGMAEPTEDIVTLPPR